MPQVQIVRKAHCSRLVTISCAPLSFVKVQYSTIEGFPLKGKKQRDAKEEEESDDDSEDEEDEEEEAKGKEKQKKKAKQGLAGTWAQMALRVAAKAGAPLLLCPPMGWAIIFRTTCFHYQLSSILVSQPSLCVYANHSH